MTEPVAEPDPTAEFLSGDYRDLAERGIAETYPELVGDPIVGVAGNSGPGFALRRTGNRKG